MDRLYSNSIELGHEIGRRATNYGMDAIVCGDGTIGAEIAIVGEAPGIREVESKIPFAGQSGNVLWTCLRNHCGLGRLDVYVTNVSKRPTAVTSAAKEENKLSNVEFMAWRDILLFELSQLPNLKHVIVLGNIALKALTGEEGIGNWRGSVLPDFELSRELDGDNWRRKVNIMCMYNPALVIREPKFNPIFQLDCAKLDRVLKGKYQGHKINALINPSFNEAYRWCEKMLDERKPVAFDIEVTGGETACVGFANNAHEGMCINFRTADENRYSVDEEVRLYRKIQQTLSHPDIKLIAQNGNFDSYWLWYKDRIRVKPLWFDTMLAHHTLYSTFPHSLGFLTSQYTEHPYYKDDGKIWKEGHGDIDTWWRYNVKDCCITWACHQPLLKELEKAGMMDFFQSHVMRLQPYLTKMTVLGTKCDMKLKEKLNEELSAQLAEIKTAFIQAARDATGDQALDPNPGSPKQLCALLYDRLHLPTKGKASADSSNRERLLAQPLLPEPQRRMLVALNKYAEEAKFLGTYVKMEVDSDLRIRCDYKQTGVQSAPGRLSSASTLWGSGTNLQNQPERAQHMFIADEGYEFSYTDGSQAEARVVAVVAGVSALRDNFARALEDSSFDVHRANASRIFRKPIEEIPTYDRDPVTGAITMRYLGKRCVHGLNYRMGPERLADVCSIPLSQANEAYYNYHRAFPEIKKWWNTTLETVRRYRELRTPFGRRLILLGINPYEDNDALDSIVAFVPQSTVGDLVSSIIYSCESDPEWPTSARMALNVHDALIALNKIEDGELVRKIMKRHAEVPIKTPHGDIFIPFEFKKSKPDEHGVHRWSTLEKVK